MRVLIVDDSEFIRMSMAKIFNDNNFEVVGQAQNGVEAIKKYKELKPDIVTMDIVMPDMNGIDAVKEIIEFDSDAKIIICSSMSQQTMVMKAVKYGAKSFLVKPIKEGKLFLEIDKIL